MSQLQYPHRAPALKDEIIVNARQRDELGETRDGLNPGLLVSQDFMTVDRHLWAAFEQILNKEEKPSEYCTQIMSKARKSNDLAVKKMFILALMVTHPNIESYYAELCPSLKFVPWFADLRHNIDQFLQGVHRNGITKCVKPTDAKYASVTAFVASMTAYYVNL